MTLFDSHIHLDDARFDPDLADVIERARAADLVGVLTVSQEIDSALKSLEIAKKFPGFVNLGFGVHPCSVREANDGDSMLALIEKHQEELSCIGEVGLDFSPNVLAMVSDGEELKRNQRAVFAKHIAIAQKYDLPLNVHSRGAGHHAIEQLISLGATKVLLHAFDGNKKYVKQAVDAGYYFSIPPACVRDSQKLTLIKAVPLENLLLESDAPALGQTKDERNEPCWVNVSCREIAKVKGVTDEEVRRVTMENAKKLFSRCFRSAERSSS